MVCLNVRSGGGDRWSAILTFVDRHDPDVVVFTEWRRRPGPGPAELWAKSRDMQWACASDGTTANGIAIAAKLPFTSASVTPGRESPGTLLKATFADWTMLAAYFPQGDVKGRYFEASRRAAATSTPFLLVGDLNTGNQVADKTPNGERFACSERFDELSSAGGLVDLWRLSNGAAAREWTWTTPKNGFRIDHAFGDGEFVHRYAPSCRYDHSTREMKMTDHSALLLTLTSGAATSCLPSTS